MSKEREGFREQLMRLDERYPGREVLTIKEASEVTGLHRGTLLKSKDFPAQKLGGGGSTGGVYIIPKVGLARWLVSIGA